MIDKDNISVMIEATHIILSSKVILSFNEIDFKFKFPKFLGALPQA